ncbi:DUF4258 domain-containing protein [Candidatus Peregrinibacteria bacterium]|nr:DUF4258 domain-containing protein [Candidatus Peregrinibacteria bacterium]
MKPIHFSQHALDQTRERKAKKEEVEYAIRKGDWKSAEKDRMSSSYTFSFESEHYGRYYKSKDVVPIFIEESDRIEVITVYTFFSQKEVKDEGKV